MKKILRNIKDLGIEQKLKRCFIFVVAFASLSGILSIGILVYTVVAYENALLHNGFSQGEIGVFNTNLNVGAALTRDFILLEDKEGLDELQQKFSEVKDDVDDSLEDLKGNCTTAEEKEIIANIEALLPDYRSVREEVIRLGVANKKTEAQDKLQNEALPIMDQVSDYADELVALNKQMGNQVARRLFVQSVVIAAAVAAFILFVIGVSIRFAAMVAKMISHPIHSIKEAAEQLLQGNLNVNVKKEYDDEIGQMTESFDEAMHVIKSYIDDLDGRLGEVADGNFDVSTDIQFRGDFRSLDDAVNKISISLSETMGKINEASEQVALGSSQMAVSAQELAEGATDQAGAVEELTATVQNVSETVTDNAQTANKAYEHAQEYQRRAEESNADIQELSSAMNQINQTSSEVANIISEIEDIASQTNLLSLNASIEAARAGEAGKGFAVVADQIGKLASDSASSAANTRQLIENSLREIEIGNEITEKTTKSILTVIEGIQSLAESTRDISDQSMTQAEAMKQLENGIEQIAEVIQSNSAAAQETSATSEELSAQSDSLKELIGQFVLKAE